MPDGLGFAATSATKVIAHFAADRFSSGREPTLVVSVRRPSVGYHLSTCRPVSRRNCHMRKLMIAAGAAALLAASSLSGLAAEATGKIASIDAAAGTVTLDSGQTFVLPSGLDMASLQAGQDVTITYEQASDGTLNASEVKPGAM
jgi:hypothetical protein